MFLESDFHAPEMGQINPDTEIRLLVVDDHPSMRMGLVAMLNNQADMIVVAEAGDGAEAVDAYERTKPDVVLMDLRMPNVSGVEAILAIRSNDPSARIIVLSTYDWDEDIHRAIESGAKSYLLKDMSTEEITGTVRAVYLGEAVLPRHVEERLEERSQRDHLSQREREVLEALVMGHSNKEISADLGISEETVKSHLKTIYGKMRVRDRTEAAIAAIRHGIVHID